MLVVILGSSVALVLASEPGIKSEFGAWLDFIETGACLVFMVEYLVRIWTAPESGIARTPLRCRIGYLFSIMGIVDLMSFVPFIFMLYGVEHTPGMLLVQLVRLLKLTRYFLAFDLLVDVLRDEAESLMVSVMLMFIILIFASVGIYIFEHDVQPEAFGSIPHAMWWAIVTLTTVGYGDVTPVTVQGKIFATLITVVGVGSMGGDVFGNGMIDSKYFKVVGAVSEKDIFIDPNPDPLTSYKERKRLFEAKNSHWSEYKKFSKGGGVFSRNNKSIELTPEIKELLDYHEDTIGADELARRILSLKVDMLYMGGIGTYIKSTEESNLEIGDKENEFVRIDASDVRAYTICEGANLSVTQKARIEYALNGGKINLDSIDNSAGVDTSDHEVNFKILFKLLKFIHLLFNPD
jgi:hypothetical protein